MLTGPLGSPNIEPLYVLAILNNMDEDKSKNKQEEFYKNMGELLTFSGSSKSRKSA